jgi:hypothetical protein
MLTASKDEFHLIAGADNLTCYQWNTKKAAHYFCKTCGIYTHNWRRSTPEFGYNSGCLEDFDLSTLADAPTRAGSEMSLVDSPEHELAGALHDRAQTVDHYCLKKKRIP